MKTVLRIASGLLLAILFTLPALAQSLGYYEVKIDVEIWDGVDNNSGKCTNKYDIYFTYAGSTTRQTIAYQDLNPIGTGHKFYSHTASFAANRTLQKMTVYGTREWKNLLKCKGNDDNREYIIPSSYTTCYYEYTEGKIPNWASWMRVNIYPQSIAITRVGGVTELPSDSKITLAATTGFPSSVYTWQYGLMNAQNQLVWTDFPPALLTGQSTSFSANDLFGSNVDNVLGHNIYFRIRYNACYGAERYSDVVTLSSRLTSPRITAVTPMNILCAGDNNGSVKLNFERALKPNEQLSIFMTNPAQPGWTDGMYSLTALDADNSVTWPAVLPPGTYNITLQGKYPDVFTSTVASTPQHRASFTITAPAAPVSFNVTEANKRHISCYNGNDGAITVNAGGGSGGYVLWYKSDADPTPKSLSFNGAGIVTLPGLTAGNYYLNVRDRNNCYAKNADGTEKVIAVSLTQPATPLTVNITGTQEPTAFGYTNGSITALVTGGTPNPGGSYNIQWQKSDGTAVPATNSPNGSGYQTLAGNLGADTYTLTVTDAGYAGATGSTTGCTATATVVVTQPPLLEVSAVITDSIRCNGDANGTLHAAATGGKPKAAAPYYTYEWYQLAGGTLTAIGQTGTTATGLTAGQYQVKVTDANNIEKLSDIINLVDPDPLQIHFTATPASCYDGSNGAISTVITGGTPAYQYNWNTGTQASGLSGLPTGAYTLTVTDYHSCMKTDIAFVSQPAAPLRIVTPVLTYPRAYGYTDGSIKVLLNGGTPLPGGAYNITWQKSDGTVLTTHTEQAVSGSYETLLPNLGAGAYTITVTDANYTGAGPDMQGCAVTATFTLTEPPALVLSVAEQHYVSCHGDADGVLAATAGGGVPISGPLPYRFEWYKANGAAYNAIGQTTDTARGLTTGVYKVIITDWNGITKESAPILLAEPDLLQVQLTTRAVSCNGGNDGFVKSTVTGGTLPYSWSWSNSAATPDIPDQPAGDYHLLLVDGHGCTQQPSATITQPAAPLAVADVTTINPSAYTYTDGSIAITLTGGTSNAGGSYNVQWLNSNNQALSNHTEQVTPGGYITTLQNAGDGAYTLQVKDAQFSICTNNSTSGCYVSVANALHEPPLLKAVIAEKRYISCKGDSDGQLVAHATGGIPLTNGLPYQYRWFKVVNGSLQPIPQTDSIITGMPAGRYLVQVTDYNHITRSSDTFNLAEPGKLAITLNATPVTCSSGQDGSITALVSGGTAPFHYEWTTGDTTSTIRNLNEGNYLLFVKDAHSCETQNNVDIFIPGGIVIDADIKAPTCHGYCDGYIKTAISGGVPPYRYQWSTGAAGTALENLCAGKYSITILDANNCKRIQTFNLADPAPLQVQLGPDKTLCNGQTWLANADIGDPQATYVWGGSSAMQAATPQVTLSATGSYWVNVTDGKGCKGSDTIHIQQNKANISAEFVAATQVFRNEDVSLVNISSPLPEKVEWIIPSNQNIAVLQSTPLLTELRFADTGVYRIQLRSRTGDCEKLYSKDIAVLEKQSFPQPGGAQEPFIQGFEVLPNPNTGQFNVRITLDKAADIRLRLFNIISNQLVNDRKESAAVQFNISYQLNITAGTYLLLLETPLGNAIRKIIISQ